MPVALTIAGSDSGGGAGIQADLKTFAALGVHGASAIACLTAQNPRRVLGIEPVSPKMLRQQIEAVFEELKPAAVKTGMLFSAENVRIVADFFRTPHSALRTPQLVVDPVLVSTSGAKLLEPAAVKILKEKLLPLAALVTPNLDETGNFDRPQTGFSRGNAGGGAGNPFALRLRRARQRRPFARRSGSGGHFLRRQNRTASVRAVRERHPHAWHRLHLFRRDLRRAGART